MNTSIKKRKAYGTWSSSLSAETVTASSASLGLAAEYQGHMLFTESRPSEGGRVVLMLEDENGQQSDCLPRDFSVRTRVHEYGGRAWWTGRDRLYVCNWSDQRLYHLSGELIGNAASKVDPVPLTPAPRTEHGLRFADGVETPDGAWVIAVAEIHGADKAAYPLDTPVDTDTAANSEPANVIVAVPTDGSAVDTPEAMQVLFSGADFVSNPRVSPDGQWLSWVQWNHPNMPWDSTELMVAEISGTGPSLHGAMRYAGGEGVSIVGPVWTRDGRLVYSTDDNGWWNLHALDMQSREIEVITTLEGAEIGAAAWAIGTERFCELIPVDGDTGASPWLLAALTEKATDRLAVVLRDGSVHRIDWPCTTVRSVSATRDGGALTLLDYDDRRSAHRTLSVQNLRMRRIAAGSYRSPIQEERSQDVSIAKPIQFASANEEAHAFFYAPHSSTTQGLGDELPPLIVMGHGGPTSHATPSIKLAIQYWTSRGFAVADVNYRGSSGFGRAYRQGLNEAWGVADVEDCISVVEYLSNTGRVDPARCVIRGGSAGGLTVLRALQLSDVFAAGVSLYGVSDLEGLLADTHKFESRYLDNLIGRYPEHAQRYRKRSPIHHAHDINVPLLVLQGDEDKVVPPSQSEAIVQAVSDQKLPHAYVVFEGEQHGWRKSETLIRALELELWFYGAALNFTPDDTIKAPVQARYF